MEPLFKNKWAIVVGVNGYKNVNPLKYCCRDAQQFSEALRSDLGFEAQRVIELREDTALKPERNDIFDQLGRIKNSGEIAEDDLLIFYFSGHGILDKKDKRDYLLPIDASRYNLAKTAIRVEEIAEELNETGCKNLVMFVDACRELIEEGGKSVAPSIGLNSREAAERHGIVTFFSCAPQEISYEIDKLQHSSFTYCLLRAISDGEGTTVEELDTYLRLNVPLTNKENGKDPQRPWVAVEPLDKKKLPIFASEKRRLKIQEYYEEQQALLADYWFDHKLDNRIYDSAVLVLAEAMNGNRDQKRLRIIETLCKNEFGIAAFVAAWKAAERERPPSAGAGGARRLEPLTNASNKGNGEKLDPLAGLEKQSDDEEPNIVN